MKPDCVSFEHYSSGKKNAQETCSLSTSCTNEFAKTEEHYDLYVKKQFLVPTSAPVAPVTPAPTVKPTTPAPTTVAPTTPAPTTPMPTVKPTEPRTDFDIC